MWISCNQHPPEGVVVFVKYHDDMRMVVKDGVAMFYYFDAKNVMWPVKFKHLNRWRFPKKGERV